MSNRQNAKKYGGNLQPLPVQWIEAKGEIVACFGSKLCVFSSKTGYLLKSIDANHSNIIAFTLNQSKHFQEAITLDATGYLIIIDIKSGTVTAEHTLPNLPIVHAKFSSDSSSLFYLDANANLHVYKIAKSQAKPVFTNKAPLAEPINQDEIHLEITKDEAFAIISVKDTVQIIEIEDQKILRSIKHPRKITALAVSPSVLVVGDEMGKITYYRQSFETTDFTSNSVHWHSQSVKSLAFNQDNSLLFSGGEEGVLVVWHQYEDKRDFYPRLGSEITCLSVSPENDLIGCSLKENSISFLQVHNFEVQFRIAGFTNPLAYPQVQPDQDIFCTKFPQNEDSHLICLNSLPGRIQFISLFEQRKIKEIDVVARNLTSRSGSYLPDPARVKVVAFDSQWKDMVTVSERRESEISLSVLKFWHESSNLSYTVNTRIEHPHGDHVFDAVQFYSQSNHSTKFVTFGSDNKFKVWKKYTRKAPNNKSGEVEVFDFFWNCELEGSYKNKRIVSVSHSLDDDDNDILSILFEDVYLKWNITTNQIKNTLSIGIPNVKKFEVNLEQNSLYAINGNTFKALNLSGSTLFELKMNDIVDLVVENSLGQVSLLIVAPSGSCAVITLSTKDFSVISAFALPNQLSRICYVLLERRKILMGLDSNMNFVVLDKSFEENEARKYLALQASSAEALAKKIAETESLKVQSETYKTEQKDVAKGYAEAYSSSINYQFRQDFKKVSEFYNEKSHLIPPSRVVFHQFFDALMLKNNVASSDDLAADLDIFASIENNNIEVEDSDSEDEDINGLYEKQQLKSKVSDSAQQLSIAQQNQTNDKWIKDTHKFIENIFTAKFS